MATMSQTAPYNLDVTAAPDIMDLHNDSGFEFADGDIDLDLRSTGQQDDDLSLYDATTDAGLEVQTIPADQDDFMVDNEDVIEEDLDNYGDNDVDIVDIEEPSTRETETANVEDDLIDYSDEEGETMWNNSQHDPDPVNVGAQDTAKHADDDSTIVEELAQARDTAAKEELTQDLGIDINQHSDTNHENDIHANDDDFQEFAEQSEDVPEREDATTYIDQPNELDAIEETGNVQDEVDFSNNVHDETTFNEDADQRPQELHIHPVTVNYDSSELWLFKHHDFDNSGDFLVEDEDLASEPLSSLLEACRAALGSDVTDNVELGFRLDNFHNVELYQEHTSCAFITLEHLVNLYQQLHIQDGVSSPESFYMTLLFRPRVSALLNELSKAASEGIGHTGLDRAIAAGLTAFNAHLSHSSTEHNLEDWDNGDGRQEQDLHEEASPSEKAGHVEGDNERGSEVHEQPYEEHDEEQYHEQYKENGIEHPPTKGQSPSHVTSTPAADSTNDDSAVIDDRDVTSGSQPPVDQSRSNSAHASPTSHHEEDDIIDYSDEEADPDAAHTDAGKATPPSSSSSTVQGDDALHVRGNDEALNNHGDVKEVEAVAPVDQLGDETGGDFPLEEAHQPLYEGFDEYLGEEYAEENEEAHEMGFTNGELEEYSTERPTQINDEDTNLYDDVEHGIVEASIDLNQAEFEDDSNNPPAYTSTVEDTLAAADEFLDFDTAAPDADPDTSGQAGLYAGEDELEYDEDDEDGAVGPALVAASVAAEAVDTLSSELLELSPQGQKRTIDEVGTAVGEATDSSDAKRPRV